MHLSTISSVSTDRTSGSLAPTRSASSSSVCVLGQGQIGHAVGYRGTPGLFPHPQSFARPFGSKQKDRDRFGNGTSGRLVFHEPAADGHPVYSDPAGEPGLPRRPTIVGYAAVQSGPDAVEILG